MKLATLKSSSKDGRLVVVSRDLRQAADASAIAPTLLAAIETWATSSPKLQELSDRLNAGKCTEAFDFEAVEAAAPLPRSPQWCDASAFLNHVRLMETAFNMPPIPGLETVPLMYQGCSDDFIGPCDDVPLPDEAHGIDFEGEFGVILDHVPLGCSAQDARRRIILITQINDVSLRALGPREMRTGFGFFQAKPTSSFAPVVVTPDELGDAWRGFRVHLDLNVELNGRWFGDPNGGDMNFGFDELVAHAAKTRKLTAGTIIGSGTVSNAGDKKGSACIAERRAIETIEAGAAKTPFMRFGDRVRMEARNNGKLVFGAIDQRFVQSPVSQE